MHHACARSKNLRAVVFVSIAMRPTLVFAIAVFVCVTSTSLAAAQTTEAADAADPAPLDEPTAARCVGLGDFSSAAESLEQRAATAPPAQAMAWRAAAVRLRLALGDDAMRSLDAAVAAAAREASLRPAAWALVETAQAHCDGPAAPCAALLRRTAERLGEAPVDVRMRALVTSARAAASPDAQRRLGLDALGVFRRACEATVPRARCAVPDSFATLLRSVRRRDRRASRVGYVSEAPLTSETTSDVASTPTSGGRFDRAREAAAEAARIVWEVDARRLDAPVVEPDLPMSHSAWALWSTRVLTPWVNAQMHTLAALDEAMWQARGLGGEHHVTTMALAAERAVQFARRMERLSALRAPVDADVLDVWDAPPPPWEAYLDGAREGFAVCRDAAMRARWITLLARCERGLTELDRARFPAADEIVAEPSAAVDPRSMPPAE